MPFLDWVNKNQAKDTSRQVPYHLLKREQIYGDAASAVDNLVIQGDNLLALKALIPLYAGRVDCIYIDPPYNTRSAFSHYDDRLEHSQWLSMMYPRLVLLRELLAEDGSIWVSIDDNEGHYLKVLMDEVFGRHNFNTTFIWQKVDSPNDNKVPITPDHEFVLCYERNKDQADFRKKSDSSLLEAYGQTDDQGRLYRDRLLKKNGKNSLRSDRPTMYYPLEAPDGTEVYPIHDDGREARWSHSYVGVMKAKDDGRLIWKKREKAGGTAWVPYIREFAPESPDRPHPTILLDTKTSRQAKIHQRDLLTDVDPFDTVKPEQLIQRVLDIATQPGDLVLDSFLGSGTTAAVAHKMDRRYIGIELGRHASTHCIPRLQSVIAGEQGGISEAIEWQGGGGFTFCTLGDAAFDEDGRINPDVRFATLAAYVWHIETGTPGIQAFDSPLVGIHEGTAYFLLYNGILGDRRPAGGNVLTHDVLAALREFHSHTGPVVVYGEVSRIGPTRLAAANITFKQIPYDVKAR
ncbi:site-specific DNA-methyltransferase [Paraburkholderia dinghuensis]|uniref:Site-specific DNA-methyltransferase n=1 Tax=Paraburkholderia dinghuensis TaxID=2305225 RepID=A0A3N6MB91_9BURK|nr:site-specific DNA-methyltransferase [Paraburkholderia dinghuensis]RQG99837.1 site-specific DNA-methyltransferase [Paraburkholderia dinghuensis]